MKKHMVHFLWHMQAEHTLTPPVFTVVLNVFLLFLMIQFFVFFNHVNLKGFPWESFPLEFLAGQR